MNYQSSDLNKNEKAKRARSANWETKEKILLREIIRPYLRILNNKSLHTSTNEAKKRAWVEITKKFNSIRVNRKRTVKQMLIQWKKMKILMNKQIGEEDKSIDDPGLEVLNSETRDTSDNMLDHQYFKVESNGYSSDIEEDATLFEESNTPCETNISSNPVHNENPNIHVQFEVLSTCNDSSTQTDDENTTSLNKQAPDNTFSEKHYEDMRYYRDMENNRLEKEHLLRLRTMQDQHNQLMKNLRLQEEILKKQLSKID